MARIDLFLDLDKVLQEDAQDPKTGRVETFPIRNAVRALNFFINEKLKQGHHVTIVPVTSLRKDITRDELRKKFEGIGVCSGLPIVHYDDGPRDSVVARRNAKGKNDAYVIFDDQPEVYPADDNLIAVRKNIRDMVTGITSGHTQKAVELIDAQLAAAPVRNDPPRHTASTLNGPDDVA